MRKSSLGRRSSNMTGKICLPSDIEPGSKKKEQKSMLLKPGFAINRRASSEDRRSSAGMSAVCMSSVKRATLQSSARKSRSQSNLLATMTPSTPKNFQNNLPIGSTRLSRSQMTSMDSNRLSSFGGVRSTKKETRPINDKGFQADALKKVQDFFLQQINAREILDNSMSIKPLTTKKFINMVDYLLKCLNINFKKEMYVDEIIKTMKQLGYGGKVEKSWLITVTAQHTWQYVISMLVWLVDVVTLSNIAADNFSMLYPEMIEEMPMDDKEDDVDVLMKENIKHIMPFICEAYVSSWLPRDPDYKAKKSVRDDEIVAMILEKKNLNEDAMAALEENVAKFEAVWNNPELKAEEVEIQEKVSYLNNLRQDQAGLKDFIEKTEHYVQSRSEEIESLCAEINQLKHRKENRAQERDHLKKQVQELKKSLSQCSKSKEERIGLQQKITFNEKCIAELSKSIYSYDIKIVKLQKKMDEPLVTYSQLVAENSKDEPRLKSCMPSNVLEKHNPITVADVNTMLNTIKGDWHRKGEELSSRLTEATSNSTRLEDEKGRLIDDIERAKTKEKDINHDIEHLIVSKAKQIKEYQEELLSLEENTRHMTENKPKINKEQLEELITIDKEQKEYLIEIMGRAEDFFNTNKSINEGYAKELKRIVESGVADVENAIALRKGKGNKKHK